MESHVEGEAVLHQVNAQQALEGYSRVQPLDLISEPLDPVWLQAED